MREKCIFIFLLMIMNIDLICQDTILETQSIHNNSNYDSLRYNLLEIDKIEDNYIIENIGKYVDDFVSLERMISDEDKIRVIGSVTREYLKLIDINNIHDISDRIMIEWSNITRFHKKQVIDDIDSKLEEYWDCVNKLDEEIRYRRTIEDEIKQIEQQISSLENIKDLLKGRLLRLREIVKFDLINKLKDDIENIPQFILVMGQVSGNDNTKDIAINRLHSEISNEALSEIVGWEIIRNVKLQGNEENTSIFEFFKKQTMGRTTLHIKYPKSIVSPGKITKIFGIEVLPYQQTLVQAQSNLVGMDGFDIKIKTRTRKYSELINLDDEPQVKEFIDEQNRIYKQQNRKYRNKINLKINEYIGDVKKYNDKIYNEKLNLNEVEESIIKLKIKINSKTKLLKSVFFYISELEKKKNNAKNKYQNAVDNRTEIFFVSRNIICKGAMPYDEIEPYITEIYNDQLNDIKRTISKIQVYKEKWNGISKRHEKIESKVLFQPNVIEFKLVDLSYKKNSSNKSYDFTIAFKVNWEVFENKLNWKLFEHKDLSYNDFLNEEKHLLTNGWRLPTINDLKKLFVDFRINENSKIVNFINGVNQAVVFSKSTSQKADQYYGFDLISQKITTVYSMDECLFILIKEI